MMDGAMFGILFLLTGASAFCTIRADKQERPQAVYVFKPLTMFLIISLALLRPMASPKFKLFILLGLALGLVGDVLLMLPVDRFLWGLCAFLAGHVAYIVALLLDGVARPSPWTALPFVLYLAVVTVYLRPHLGHLTVPVIIYELVILSMAWLAWLRYEAVGGLTILAFYGALLFVVSDTVLAIGRFARPVKRGQAIVLGSYFAAQWLIAAFI